MKTHMPQRGEEKSSGSWPLAARAFFTHRFSTLASLAAKYDECTLLIAFSLIWCFIFQQYYVFDRLFLFDKMAVDTILQFYPIEYYRVNKIASGQLPFWSFQFSLGENVYNLFTAINPFNAIYILFGKEQISQAVIFVVFLKFMATALFFYEFLKKIAIPKKISLVGALAYTFSAHMILNSHWYHYPNYAVLLAMFLYFFEVWYQHKKWLPLVFIIGILSIKIELQLVHLAFFVFFYVLYRCINSEGDTRAILHVYIKLAFIYTLGIVMWSFFIIPDVYRYFLSARVHDAFASPQQVHFLARFFHLIEAYEAKVILARFFYPEALSSWFNYRGATIISYFEDSSMYVGTFAWILFFAPYVVKNNNYKKLWIFNLVSIIILLFPYIRSALLLFVSTSLKHLSLYFGSFYLISSILILKIFFYDSENKDILNIKKSIIITYIITTVILFNVYKQSCMGNISFNLNKIFLSFTFMSLNVFLLLVCKERNKEKIKNILCIIIVAEIICTAKSVSISSPGAIYPFFEKRHDIFFQENTANAIKYIKNIDNSFFRIEKNYNDSMLNDALIQGYFGTTSYLAFPHAGMKQLWENYDLKQSYASYMYGLEGHSSLQNLINVKYVICKDGLPCEIDRDFSLIKKAGDLSIYRNTTASPFGQMFYAQIKPKDFQALPLDIRNDITPDVLVSEEYIPGIPIWPCTPSGGRQGARGAFKLLSWNEENFVGEASLERHGVLFFAVPHDPGWQVWVDGVRTRLLRLDFAFSGLALPPGEHRVELRYRPPFLMLSWLLSALALLLTLLIWRRYPKIFA